MIELAPRDQQGLMRRFPDARGARRLAVRVAALAARGVAVSLLLAEEAVRSDALMALLLRRELLDADDPAAVLVRLLDEPAHQDAARELPLTVIRQEGLRVIVAEEEVEAASIAPDENTAKELSPAASTSTSTTSPPASASLSALDGSVEAENLRAASSGSSAAPDPARLRVTVFAGAGTEEKVAALRQLAYSSLDPAELREIFLQALADPDRALRAVAAQGAVSLGLAPELADAARLLADGEAPERAKAADRLADLAPAVDAFGRDALVMALMGLLRDTDSGDADLRLAHDALARSADALGPERLCQDDVVRALLDGALRGGDGLLPTIAHTLRGIDRLRPGWPGGRLADAALQSHSPAYRGLLFQLLTGLDVPGEMRARLAPVALDTALALPVTGDACAQATRFVLDDGPEGMARLADRLPQADTAHQSHFLRLLDNTLCLQAHQAPAADIAERLSLAALALFRNSPRQIRAELLETRVAALPGVSEALRGQLAEALLADIGEYAHWRLAEGVEQMLRRIGSPATDAILRTLRENKNSPDLDPLVDALGHLGRNLADQGDDASRARAEDILRALQLLSFGNPPFLDAVHRAQGRIAGSDLLPAAVGRLVWRTLFARLSGGLGDAALLEGLAYAADGPGVEDGQRAELVARARERLGGGEANDPGTTRLALEADADVFEVDPALWGDARLVPAALDALGHVAASSRAPEALVNDIALSLLDLWERATRFELVWGPANNARLTDTLGGIGRGGALASPLRIRLARTLAQRSNEPIVMRALASLLERGDDSDELDRLAAGLILRVLKTLSPLDDAASDERETWLRLLAHLGLRGRFGLSAAETARLAERMVAALSAGLRGGASGLYAPLRALADSGRLPGEASARLDAALSRWGTLAVRR